MRRKKFLENIGLGESKHRLSYSQMGEDLVIQFLLKLKDWSDMFYIDIGSNDPIKFSNTYKFYKLGASGICIDPNPAFVPMYKRKRKRDKFINAGIGVSDAETAEFYEMNWHVFSTFDKEQAEVIQDKYQGRNNIVNVRQLPLISVNTLGGYIGTNQVDLLSLDVEGLDLEILQQWDFEQHPPRVVCVEIYDPKEDRSNDQIHELLIRNGYRLAASNPINGIYTRL